MSLRTKKPEIPGEILEIAGVLMHGGIRHRITLTVEAAQDQTNWYKCILEVEAKDGTWKLLEYMQQLFSFIKNYS